MEVVGLRRSHQWEYRTTAWIEPKFGIGVACCSPCAELGSRSREQGFHLRAERASRRSSLIAWCARLASPSGFGLPRGVRDSP